jgi:sugar phosphate isomerase/epimerase
MIASHTWSFSQLPLKEVLPRLHALGFDGVELNAEAVPNGAPHVTPAMSAKERDDLRALLDRTRLTVSSISAHRSLIERSPDERRGALDFTRGCIDLAVELGANVVHAFSGAAPDGVETTAAWEWLESAIDAAARYAAERNVRFAIEAAVGRLVARTADVERLTHAVSGPLYVNFDPSHLHLAGDDVAAAIRKFGSLIAHVHVKDARGTSGKGGYSFPPLGEGTIDFVGFFAALREIGYTGFYSLEDEAHEFGYPGDPFQRAKEGLAFVRGHLDLLP